MIDKINIFITAGYPELDSLPPILEKLIESGVKTVEIGFPYSDPLADGPVIQESSVIAIKNGIKPDLIFDQLQSFKGRIKLIPMAYLNSLLQYGIESFLERCSLLSIEDIIVPDLPLIVYQSDYKSLFLQYNVSPIFLLSPNTSNDRIKKLAQETGSFLYAVSSSSTTGNSDKKLDVSQYLQHVQSISKKKVACGFNIKTKEDVQSVLSSADYAIIGSEFIRQFAQSSDTVEETVETFIKRFS